MLKSLVAVTAGLVGGAHAFWRMECPGRVGLARLDPIVNPGALSHHVHAIHGSSGFSDSSTTTDLLNGDCTSCRVTQDKSSYWHPALYFQDGDTGAFELVEQVGGMLAYYLLYGDNVTAFPANFRMLSGTNTRRTYTAGDPSKPDPEKSLWSTLKEIDQDTLSQRALGFNCLNYARNPEGTLYRHYMPDKSYLDANCKDGLRLEIMFPSCWKGGNAVDSDNHKDHVAFPDLVMTGTCPEGFPVRLPSLMYEVIWNTAAFSGRNGRFVLSNGDTTGYGYHADFITGWDPKFLQDAVDTCTSESGMIQDCPLFNVVDESIARSCEMKLPKVLADENVIGPCPKLPGGVEVTYGDGSTGGSGGPAPSEGGSMPTLTYAPGERPTNSASPLPGQVFKESSVYEAPAPPTQPATTLSTTATPSSTPVSAPTIGAHDAGAGSSESTVPTTTPAPEFVPLSDSATYFSTQYITSGNLVSKILWEEKLVYVTVMEDFTTTVTVTTGVPAVETPAARRRRRHFHGHGHHHHQEVK